MTNTRSSLFGNMSLLCAALAIIASATFFFSGYVMPGMFEEKTIVITQMLSLFFAPFVVLIGLICGIMGLSNDVDTANAKAGAWLNGLLLALMALAAAFLMIASSETQPADRSRVPEVRIEGEAAATVR